VFAELLISEKTSIAHLRKVVTDNRWHSWMRKLNRNKQRQVAEEKEIDLKIAETKLEEAKTQVAVLDRQIALAKIQTPATASTTSTTLQFQKF
jgi:hypothetical protein